MKWYLKRFSGAYTCKFIENPAFFAQKRQNSRFCAFVFQFSRRYFSYPGRYFLRSPNYFFLSYKKVFVTKFLTRITNFVTCITKFLTSVTKFVTNFFLYDSKKQLAENKNYPRDRKVYLGDNFSAAVCRPFRLPHKKSRAECVAIAFRARRMGLLWSGK